MDNMNQLEVRPVEGLAFVSEKLADGSSSLLETGSRTVYSLNAPAAAAFDACRNAAMLPRIAQAMGAGVTQEQALHAVAQLEKAGLVEVDAGRRDMLKKAGAIMGGAIAAVLVLSASEQKAYAGFAGSQPPTDPR
jgi:hypothetical protein